jgi:DeoR family transcriptional regulator, fructose operon transcriptional repressor
MLTAERHRQILRLLAERGRLSLSEISSRLGVSAATARRDATELGDGGRARRVHGALLPRDFGLEEPRYSRKAERAVTAKLRLGRAAAALLPDAGTIFIDAGTTCLEVGRSVLDRSDLRIYTNSLPLLSLAPEARATLVSVGGEVRPLSLALTGAFALQWLENLRFDAAVIGASGLDPAAGASTTETAEAGVKSEALRRATRRILVAHGDKWNRPAPLRFAAWKAFSDFVTDHPFTRAERLALSHAGLALHAPQSRP